MKSAESYRRRACGFDSLTAKQIISPHFRFVNKTGWFSQKLRFLFPDFAKFPYIPFTERSSLVILK